MEQLLSSSQGCEKDTSAMRERRQNPVSGLGSLGLRHDGPTTFHADTIRKLMPTKRWHARVALCFVFHHGELIH
jgi:hypothetical protein